MRPSQLILLVLVASAIVSAGLGLGLYFGLRPNPPPAPPRVDRSTAERDALAALERERPRLVEACAHGSAPRNLRLSMAFGPEGQQLGLGIIDDRSAPRSDVYQCLQQHLGLGLRIPPPGAPVSLELPFTFP